MLKIKILPSTEKCFLDDDIEQKYELREASMLRNERFSFQLAYTCFGEEIFRHCHCTLSVEGALADKLQVAKIENVPVTLPLYRTVTDDDYLRYTPGLFPDLLIPYTLDNPVVVVPDQLRAYLFTIEDTDGIAPGEYELKFTLTHYDEPRDTTHTVSQTLKLTVVDEMLPAQELIHTQWFHCDCIATHYNCEIFSERHFELIGNFMEAARKCGVNMMFTPVLTPPLDTGVGRERPTVQLVDVTVTNGKYSFGFDKLDRYINLALERGMEYFEISHLFSQWGAKYAPKVMATVDGEYKRIFGWDTEGTGEAYAAFIREFLSALVERLKALGVDKRCYFHISDEPGIQIIEGYTKAKNIVADILEGYPIMDALSSYEFYESGAVTCPIPSVDHAATFIENNVPNLWTYYCTGQHCEVSNRFVSMPGQRTRVLGTQLFKYNIKGFLQWGFNFWYSQFSIHYVNPFVDTNADYFVLPGDAFSVYPGNDGKALYSLHALHFYEALQDMRALNLLAQKIGHDKVVALMEEGLADEITFKVYPRNIDYLLTLRERVNKLLKK